MKPKKAVDPNVVWAKMQAEYDLEDDDIPEWLAADIQAWNPVKSAIEGKLPITRPLNRSFNGEAVLRMLNTQEYPERPMVARMCRHCGEVFRTSYKSNAYCTDHCRRMEMAQFGIDWHERYEVKSEVDEWGGRVPPYVIPPNALRVMKFLVNEAEALKGAPIEPWIPKYTVQMNGGLVELVHEEEQVQNESPDPLPDPSVPKSLIERLSALRLKTGLGN